MVGGVVSAAQSLRGRLVQDEQEEKICGTWYWRQERSSGERVTVSCCYHPVAFGQICEADFWILVGMSPLLLMNLYLDSAAFLVVIGVDQICSDRGIAVVLSLVNVWMGRD